GDAIVEGTKSGNSYSAREYFTADLIAYTTQSKDSRFLTLIERMIPNPISDARLAFNLSCLHALYGNKKEMLQYMKIAIFLGKPTVDFEKDQDFRGFRSDPDFIRTLLWGGPALDPSLIPPAIDLPRGNPRPSQVPAR
ncbi:TPR end-of-group domain-containing protein, partial [Leptospira ellisii]